MDGKSEASHCNIWGFLACSIFSEQRLSIASCFASSTCMTFETVPLCYRLPVKVSNHLWLLQLDSSMGSLCADNLFVEALGRNTKISIWGSGEYVYCTQLVKIQLSIQNLYFFDCSSHLDTFVCPLPLVGLKLPWDLSASALAEGYEGMVWDKFKYINSNNCDSNIIFETDSMFRTVSQDSWSCTKKC